MHIHRIITFVISWVFFLPFIAWSKELKPTLLVYGDNVEAFAAAVQSSRSNVPTVWVVPSSTYAPELMRNQISIQSNDSLDSGIWLDVLRKIAKMPFKSDSLVIATKRHLNPQEMKDAIQRIIDGEKNLKIVMQGKINKLEQGKKDWTVYLSNKQKYEVRTVIDATADMQLKSLLKGDDPYLKPSKIQLVREIALPLRRTLVAVAEYKDEVYGFTLTDMLSRSKDNLYFVGSLIQVSLDEESIPLRFQVGQAIGAIGGYCAFFKTTSDKIDIRKLQSELLAFEVRFLPYRTISTFSPHFAAFQRIFLTGIYVYEADNQALTFDMHSKVYAKHIQQAFLQLYSRSQLWFKNNEKEILNLRELSALLKNVAFRGDEIDELIEKEWQHKLKFNRPYNAETLEKYEFEVLFDKYAQPFTKSIDQSGNILR